MNSDSNHEVSLNSRSPYFIFDNMLEGCQVIGYDWRYFYVNNAVAKHARVAKENLLGRTMMDVFPEIESMSFFSILKQCMEERTPRQIENPFTFPDGTMGHFELRIQPVPEGILILSLDISKHKLVEQELRFSKNQLELVLQGAELGTWDWNFQTGEVAFNKRWTEMLGYSQDEVEPHVNSWQKLVHPDDMIEVMKTLKRHLEGEIPNYESVHRLRHKSGKWIWILDKGSVLQRDEEGKPLRVCGTHLDITEHKQTEETLKYQSQLLKEMGNIAHIGGWEFDPATGKGTWTDEVVRIFDYDPDKEIDVRRSFTFYQGNSREKIEKAVKEASEHGTSYDLELEILTARNVHKWVRTIGRVKMENGRPSQVIGSIQDITERRNLEDQLRQAQKMEAVGRLAGGVAHDYNNMLSVIIGNAEVAIDDMGTTTKDNTVLDDLKEILNAGNRSAEITQQLLAFARKQTIAPVVLDLNATLERMMTMLGRLIGEDIDLAWYPSEGVWPVKIDPAQIDQILVNLCVNARDAISGIGKITIETGNITFNENYCIEHAGFIPGEFVMMAVSDTGRGMAKEIIDHIFEPFFTTKTIEKGTGLGLSTVYGIVKQNKGFINVYSEPNQGTTFKLYLSRFTDGFEKIELKAERDTLVGCRETVLLVEDELAILKLGKRILDRLDYNVLIANTPQEAINVAQAHAGEIHLLITDVIMPEMNGRELAKRLTDIHPGIKTLFMSGYTANVIVHHGVLETGVHFMPKPFSLQDLAQKTQEALKG